MIGGFLGTSYSNRISPTNLKKINRDSFSHSSNKLFISQVTELKSYLFIINSNQLYKFIEYKIYPSNPNLDELLFSSYTKSICISTELFSIF